MRRGWKILIAVGVVLLVLIGVNALVTGAETKPAGVTEPGGRIVSLPGGDIEVVEKGPRAGSPIVLIHCFTCAIDWWGGMIPILARDHRVVAVDLLGHGGSEKPKSGYSIPNQADLVAGVLGRLGVRDAEVVGHSLGGVVVTALAERSPQLVDNVVIVDTATTHENDLGLLAKLVFVPVIGDALWRIKPDFATRKGLEVAFAPGFQVPDAFVENVNEMTYTAYNRSARDSEDYSKEEGLAQRMKESGKPLLVIMGAEEQIIDDPPTRLAEYRRIYPGTKTKLIQGAGHSPNVEKPAETAALVLAFDKPTERAKKAAARHELQKRLQDRESVRKRP